MRTSTLLLCTAIGTASFMAHAEQEKPYIKKEPVMTQIKQGEWQFGGELGRRIEANVTNWLLRAPETNPGILEILNRRDRRKAYPEHIPWAGEFPGKYLISAVQACYMSRNPELRGHVQAFVDELIAAQAEDGYLGPWFKDERMLGHWDLWGHYHCILGLLAWNDLTGDQAALDAAIRAGDCIVAIYGEGGRRPVDAGTPEVNLAVLHGLGELYRRTGTEGYLTVMHRIVEDMPRDGDWLRQGDKGVPYHQLPGSGPRWESIHTVQGLIELHYITGERKYANAAENLWKSLRDFDRHPSGAFSTHERAYGTVYAPGALESCCSVAWEAFSVDMLKLTGDPTIADEIELTTWNQVLGAQHPSGSWWTYNTPIDGVRLPSFHEINFQVRPGTPELNCCSVNAPRGLGMLAEWAVLAQDDAVVVNFYGPSTCHLTRENGTALTLTQETAYPVDGTVRIVVTPEKEDEFALRLRIPAWSKETSAQVNGKPLESVQPGTYLDIPRKWSPGDTVELSFDMSPRSWLGEAGRHGQMALYAGPLLLTFDAYFNELETTEFPPVDFDTLSLRFEGTPEEHRLAHFAPLGLWSCKAADGTELTLCDFASAGAHGTDYLAWLPAANVPPVAAALILPEEDAKGAPGPILFSWDTFGHAGPEHTLIIARDAELEDVVRTVDAGDASQITVTEPLPEGAYYWGVVSRNDEATVANQGGARRLLIDAGSGRNFFALGEHGLMAASLLDGDGTPRHGVLQHAESVLPAEGHDGAADGGVGFDGIGSGLRYALPFFPEEDYSFVAWVRPGDVTSGGFHQIFSAWCQGGDDPLRVTVEKGEISARIEAPTGYVRTPGTPLALDEWVHVAAVKDGEMLTLYLDGAPVGVTHAAQRVVSASLTIGLGHNPLLPGGGEYFRGSMDDFAFYAEALTPAQVKAIHEGGAF